MACQIACQMAWRAAYEVSLAVASGDVCVPLAAVAAALDARLSLAEAREMLLTSGIVGTPTNPGALPLILDQQDRVYLHRYFDYECRLARCLAARGSFADATIAPEVIALLHDLFPENTSAPGPDWQKLAAGMALLGNLSIISGGPGTGKTTTVVNLLACLLAHNPDCRIALAAPTGKAAARMIEAIRLRAAHLPAALQARLPTESFTLHRLLGVTPAAGEFRHHAENRLPIDALVVDEASMLDLALATKLFEAVPNSARIILLGDKDQLAAVESGAVFSELSADPGLSLPRRAQLAELCATPLAAIQPPTPSAISGLSDCVIWLTQNFRFASDSGIGQLAAEINAGTASAAINRLRAGADPRLNWIDDAARMPSKLAIAEIYTGYADYLAVVRDGVGGDSVGNTIPAAAFHAFARFRSLCAVREGPRGVVAINRMVEAWFRNSLAHRFDLDEGSPWYPGRPVMVLRNDYVLKLFNGDIGIVLPDAQGTLMVWFPDPTDGYRAIAPVRLPEHETAFAMTVHKSQGSEFDAIVVLLPAEPNRVLTRELIYTAITRARKRMTLVSSANVLEHAIKAATPRHSGLAARLEEQRSPLADSLN
jgi:exodeoxyribonuclease V alpha subunit